MWFGSMAQMRMWEAPFSQADNWAALRNQHHHHVVRSRWRRACLRAGHLEDKPPPLPQEGHKALVLVRMHLQQGVRTQAFRGLPQLSWRKRPHCAVQS